MGKYLNNIFFAVGLIAVIVMLCTFDVSFIQLWEDITKAGYWLILILGLWLILYVMNTMAWKIIIGGGGSCVIGFFSLLKLTITGFALNYATPMGLLGGEAYKIMEMSRYIGIQRATSSVILFTMMHVFSHLWFWLTGVVVYLILSVCGIVSLDTGMQLILIFATCFCGVGIYLFVRGYKNGMVMKLLLLVSRIPGLRSRGIRFIRSHRANLEKIDRQISELHGQNKRSFWGSFFLEYFGRLLQSFEILFMLMLFGIDNGGGLDGFLLTFLFSFLILAFTSLFANLLGFLPLQLGGREGGFAMSVTQLGMSGDISMFVSIICRVREIFWTCTGLFLMKLGEHPSRTEGTPCK